MKIKKAKKNSEKNLLIQKNIYLLILYLAHNQLLLYISIVSFIFSHFLLRRYLMIQLFFEKFYYFLLLLQLKMENMLNLFFFIGFVSANLMCRGDFEDYILNDVYQGDPYALLASDPDCWYNKNNGLIQVKSKVNPLTTNGGELTSISPYTLCQKISLVPGKIYKLQYTLLCPSRLSKMLLLVKFNQVQVSTLYLANPNTLGTNSVNIAPSQVTNQLCFSETHVASFFDSFHGGLLDNVTLMEILSSQLPIQIPIATNQSQNLSIIGQNNLDNQTILSDLNQNNFNDQQGSQQVREKVKIILHLRTQIKQLAWEIHLIGDMLFQNYLSHSLQDRISIFLEGQLQKQSYSAQNQEGMTIIVIKVHRNYDINTLEIIAENTQNAEFLVDFQVYLNNKKIHFHLLSQNQKKIIQNLEPVSQVMPEAVFKMYEIISSSMCSYFILSLFNFWNLSLMYNFLLIDNVPNFTRNIYEIMINLLYQKGSVVEWLTKNFDIPEDVFDLSQWRGLPEKMEEYKEGFSWFGIFGFSSIALINNLDTLFILALLMLKLILLKIVIQLISKKFRNTLDLPKRLLPFFMLQLIAAVPFIIISSVVAVSSSVESPRELGQKCLQTILLFVCACVVPLWFVINFQGIKDIKRDLTKLKVYKKLNRIQKLYQKISDKINRLSSELKSEKFSLNYDLTELILNVTVPGLIWLRNAQGFLVVNTLVIVGRGAYFYRNMKKMTILNRLFGFTMALVWLIHHFDYCTFYVLSVLRQNQIGDRNTISEVEVYCGILAFLTVLVGGGIEILRFLCDIITMVFGLIQKIQKLCELRKKQKQIQPKCHKSATQISSFHFKIEDNISEPIAEQIAQPQPSVDENENNIWYIPIKIIKTKKQILKDEQISSQLSPSSHSNDSNQNKQQIN